MYAKANIESLAPKERVYVVSGWKDSYFFATAIVRAVDRYQQMVSLADTRVLHSRFKAQTPKRSCDYGINNIWVRIPDAELSLDAPFALVMSDPECFLAPGGIACQRKGDLLLFEDGTKCQWSWKDGFNFTQGGRNYALNGHTDKVLFIVKDHVIKWHNEDLENGH